MTPKTIPVRLMAAGRRVRVPPGLLILMPGTAPVLFATPFMAWSPLPATWQRCDSGIPERELETGEFLLVESDSFGKKDFLG